MQEYAFATGIFLTIARSGTVLNNYLTPILAKHKVGYASLVGLVLLIISAISGIIFTRCEKRAQQIEYRGSFAQVKLKQTFHLGFIRKFHTQFWLICFNVSLGYIGFQCF